MITDDGAAKKVRLENPVSDRFLSVVTESAAPSALDLIFKKESEYPLPAKLKDSVVSEKQPFVKAAESPRFCRVISPVRV